MLTVGQKLWFVGPHRYNKGGREVTVTSVGRKWAQLDNQCRIDIESLWADGGKYISPGRAWPNEQAWAQEQRRHRVWREFHKRLTHQPPDGVTVETIVQAAEMFGIDVAALTSALEI